MNKLEKIINTFRISPHGFTSILTSTILITDYNLNLGIKESLPENFQPISDFLMVTTAITGFVFSQEGISKYNKFKKKINQKQKLSPNLVNYSLEYYCDRQALKAAAYKTGFKEEFNQINKKYKGNKQFNILPEI